MIDIDFIIYRIFSYKDNANRAKYKIKTPPFHNTDCLLPFPVSIAVTVLLAVGVFAVTAVLAVAVIVTVLALVHVDAVDEGAKGRHLLVVLKVVDKLEVALAGEVGPADVKADVGHSRYKARIGDYAYRGAVDYDVIKVLAKDAESLIERTAGYKLRRIGRNVANGQYIQVWRHGRPTA